MEKIQIDKLKKILEKMKNNFFFLRHGEPLIDSQVPVYEWILTEFGQKQCNNLVERDVFIKLTLFTHQKKRKHI